MPDAGNVTSAQMILEIVHALFHGSNAVRKSLERELFPDGLSSDVSVYEFLENKLDTQALTYYTCARLLSLLFREFEYFNALIQNLMGFLSADQPLTLEYKSTNIGRLLEEIVALFEAIAAEKKLKIDLVVVGTPTLKVDRQLIRRAFINLMDNAIKYSYESVKDERFINVKCQRYSSRGDWAISFENYGVGITREEITSGSIFKYGARGELSGDRGRKGTGIGLAETKRIIDAHDGKIIINSNSKGEDAYLTAIRVILPFDRGFRHAKH